MEGMSAASRLSQVAFRLSTGELNGEINLKPEAWRILSQVNGVRTLGEIAQTVGMDITAATNIAEVLLNAHILEVAPGSAAPLSPKVDATFFDEVTRELARAIGPLAGIIIEDEIAALGEKRESFPRDRFAELIERVSEQVHDPNKRVRFQRVMLDALRRV
jgi:hypothetical protein